MSFPDPEYIKNFLSTKLRRTNPGASNLLEDDALQKSTLKEVTVFKDNENNLEGFEISKRSKEVNGNPHHHHDHNHRRVRSNGDRITSRTSLQLGGAEKENYGTSEDVELNEKDNSTKFRKLTPQKFDDPASHCEKSTSEPQSPASRSSNGRYAESCTSEDNEGYPHSHTSDDFDMDSEHCHDDSDEKEQMEDRKRKKALRKLVIATVLSFLFMCGEIIGGYLANSLAVMTDASHLLTDVSSFLVSIIALQMAAKPSSKSMTFGWHRAEVIGAITSVLAIWVVTGVLVYLAVMRLIKNEFKLDGRTMIITAACAVGFNIIMGLVLHEKGHSHGHGHSHDHGDSKKKAHGHNHDEEESGNVNVRAAFIHVLGDLLQSLGVLIAAFIIYFKPEYKMADPICTFLFSILVLATTITILRDTIVILMEGTPASINYEKVREKLLAIQGVIAVHDLRIWSLTLNQCVMSCHLAVDKTVRPGYALKQATRTMKAGYNFHSMTIQVEKYSTVMDDCKKCRPKSHK